MGTAYRIVDRIQDMADFSGPLTADSFLKWDGSGFVLGVVEGGGGGVSDHGALTGLADDDHPQYILVANPHAPGAGLNSVRFGTGSTAAGENALSLGRTASASGLNSVAVGFGANAASGQDAMALGTAAIAQGQNAYALGSGCVAQAVNALAIGRAATALASGIAIGAGAVITASTGAAVAIGGAARVDESGATGVAIGTSAFVNGVWGVAIGNSATVGTGHSGSIALGVTAVTTAANQFVAGNPNGPINNVFFGNGVAHTAATAWTLHGTGGSGADNAGGNLVLAPGKSTGNATPASIVLQSTVAGSSGSSPQTLYDALTIANGVLTVKDSTGLVNHLVIRPFDGAYGTQKVTIDAENATNQPAFVISNIGPGAAGILLSGGPVSNNGFLSIQSGTNWACTTTHKGLDFTASSNLYGGNRPAFNFSAQVWAGSGGLSLPVVRIQTEAANYALVLEGAVSQTANLFETRDSSANVLTTIKADGGISFGAYNINSAIGIWLGAGGFNAGYSGLTIRGATAQLGNYLNLVSPDGLTTYGTVSENGYWTTMKNAAPDDAELAAGEAAYWFDSSNGASKFMVKAKSADGTVVTGELALA